MYIICEKKTRRKMKKMNVRGRRRGRIITMVGEDNDDDDNNSDNNNSNDSNGNDNENDNGN